MPPIEVALLLLRSSWQLSAADSTDHAQGVLSTKSRHAAVLPLGTGGSVCAEADPATNNSMLPWCDAIDRKSSNEEVSS